jgi:hypothetical protein
MKVTVCLPTYRRAGALVWSIASVLVQRFEGLSLDAAPRLVVLNNDRERAPVDRAVEQALREVGARGWQVRVVHREVPMDPALNWYEGIREHAHEGGVAFLHGDDDLVVRDGLRARAAAFGALDVDVLLSQTVEQRLVFEGTDASRAWIDGKGSPAPAIGASPRRVTMRELHRYGFAFIGNVAYRNTPRLWEMCDAVTTRLRRLPVRGTQQLAMLPYFLTLEACRRGTVGAIEARCELRGHTQEELLGVRFSHANWYPGVLYAITVALLESGEFGTPEEVAAMLRQNRIELARWYFPTMYARSSRAQMEALGMDTLWQFDLREGTALAGSALLLAKGLLGLQNLSRRLWGWGTPYRRAELLARLGA